MIRVAFTGPAHTLDFEDKLVVATLDKLPPPAGIQIITGGCVGVDELVAKTMFARNYFVHTVLPSNFRLVDPDWDLHCTTNEVTAEGRTLSETYRKRNTRMVGQSHELIAFLRNNGEYYRSGEWMTVNLARKAGKKVTVIVL